MQSALETALLLAQKFGSCIEGFPLRPGVADLVAMDPDSGLTMVAVKENDAELARHAEDVFRSFMDQHSVPQRAGDAEASLSWTWQKEAPSGHDYVGSYGRVFDMIVLARPGPEWQSPSMITLESALFESGRPVLIAPPTAPRSLGKNVLIAWNCSTEQARTTADAMPFLRQCRSRHHCDRRRRNGGGAKRRTDGAHAQSQRRQRRDRSRSSRAKGAPAKCC